MTDTIDPDDFNPEGKGDWYKFRAGDFKKNPDILLNAMMENKFQEIVAKVDPNDLENLLEFQEVAQPLEYDIQVENQALAGNPKAQDLVVEDFSNQIDDYKNVTLASDEVLEKTISKKIVSEVVGNAPGWIIVPAEQMVESALRMAGNPKAAAIAGKLVRYELTMFALSLAAGAIGAGAGAMGTLQGVQSNLLLGNEKELEKRLENVESDMIENAAAVGSGMMQSVMKTMPSYWLDEWLLKKYPAFEGWKEMFPQAAVATDWIGNLVKGFRK